MLFRGSHNHNKEFLLIIALFVVAFGIYSYSLSVPFLFDDEHMIVRNSLIKNMHNIPQLFTSGRVTTAPITKGLLRPILMLTFTFNYFFSGLNPMGYHIMNIMFHFLNGVALFLLLRFLLGRYSLWPAFLTSLLFIVHPINSEAVIYISCRSTLMSTFFMLTGVLAYIRWDQKAFDIRLFWSLLMFILGILTKEIMIIFPLILISYDFIFRRQSSKNLRVFIKSYYLFFLIGIFYLILRRLQIGTFTTLIVRRSVYHNILTNLCASVFYLKLFFYPVDLCLGRFFPTSRSFLTPAVLESSFIIVSIFSFGFAVYRRFPLIIFAILWYFLNLMPKFMVGLSLVAAEHQLYLPAIGIFIIIAIFIQNCIKILKKINIRVFDVLAIAILALILIFASVFTIKREAVWQNEYSLWRSNIHESPNALGAYNNLGIVATNEGKFDEAEGYLTKALGEAENIPSSAKDLKITLLINLSNVYVLKGELSLAQEQLTKVMAINPDIPEVHNNLGLIYLKKQLRKEAIKEFKRSLELDNSSELTYLNLGVTYWENKETDLAIKTLERALEANPDFVKPYIALAKIYEKLGSYAKAADFQKRAMRLLPADAQDYYNLGILYGKNGDIRAIDAFKKTIKLDNRFAAAYYNLAITYANLNPPQIELAKKYAGLALKYGYQITPEILNKFGIKSDGR